MLLQLFAYVMQSYSMLIRSDIFRFVVIFSAYFAVFIGVFFLLLTNSPDVSVNRADPAHVAGILYISSIDSWAAAQSIVIKIDQLRTFFTGVVICGAILAVAVWQGWSAEEYNNHEVTSLIIIGFVSIIGAAMQLGFLTLGIRAIKKLIAK